jgi:DNA recombination protein RmuC
MESALFVLIGLAIGAGVVWVWFRGRIQLAEERVRMAEERVHQVTEVRGALLTEFKALSSDALAANNQRFLELAQGTLGRCEEGITKPLKESLDKVDGKIRELEKSRQAELGSLARHLDTLTRTQDGLRAETANLVTALRKPHVRGSWGEMHLKRAVELSGMAQHCDFELQATVAGDEGRLRPDMVVKLPGGRNVVVDAKVPLEAHIEAINSTDEALRQRRLADHAAQFRTHVRSLSSKAYWEHLPATPEFVVMFIPGEAFYSAALDADPALVEFAAQHKVIPATPTTLIALLLTVAHGWREERVAEHAKEIEELGRELHKRLGTMAKHFVGVGTGLDRAVAAYNSTVGTFESRVLAQARRFKELGASGGGEIEDLSQVETRVRQLEIAS